ncbi:hypothetical protein FR483_n523R [Paramecium bursaria Chlorella virus FR483]|uniref:Uncharacterized protein n523R n=1 Tax=Paramecium bursaria Chlorella virus FR483 TaxID=399781 RepID=A7J7M7_PBCVF|nr:hypothetical protein FR483_n523R [Paramecium bursaria Chlorella virus FR483]ABT15808.1 hypothetical protein FR483_n523R [Paramecium bursaria Chlorella virus FR483]
MLFLLPGSNDINPKSIKAHCSRIIYYSQNDYSSSLGPAHHEPHYCDQRRKLQAPSALQDFLQHGSEIHRADQEDARGTVQGTYARVVKVHSSQECSGDKQNTSAVYSCGYRGSSD